MEYIHIRDPSKMGGGDFGQSDTSLYEQDGSQGDDC